MPIEIELLTDLFSIPPKYRNLIIIIKVMIINDF